MKRFWIPLLLAGWLAACTGATATPSPAPFATLAAAVPTSTPQPPAATSAPTTVPTQTTTDDLFSLTQITLPAPVCSGLTQSQTEGPYYKADTPERNSLLEAGLPGERLILVGYVLDQNCNPLPNAWLDFWQTDAAGEYDNTGYRLRGHQFTDEQGRYYLETVLPGLYESRPIEHIHVKIRPEGGAEVTSQLYFPNQPIEGLTVTIEEREGYYVGYFNFVVQR